MDLAAAKASLDPEETGKALAGIKSRRVGLERIFEEDVFHSLLVIERRRVQRSHQPFILMLLEATSQDGHSESLSYEIIDAMACSVRETDFIGWYKKGAISGVIFTEVSLNRKSSIIENLKAKILATLEARLGKDDLGKIKITAHVFPEDWDSKDPDSIADFRLYPDIQKQTPNKRVSLIAKRLIDIVGSAAVLFLLSPIFALIALAIKLTSKGPVLFRQERLGLYGARFTCLKFRTMYVDCDSKIHEEYVQQFISSKSEPVGQRGTTTPKIYKITHDPRVTLVGRYLRKASFDEYPQLWNVLRGEMSLVGPRPPLPYEFKSYDVWHRRRVLEVKPGITGLWQVSGRSRTRFEEMVRLDLQYIQCWSLWMDLKILAATPGAVFSGEGAY